MSARRKSGGHSTPGLGDFARIHNPVSGREWFGQVLVWGPCGEPFLMDAETAETRWFPASWVAATIDGPPDFDRGECPCERVELRHAGQPEGEFIREAVTEPDRACPHHGDPATVAAAILKRARSRT